MYLLTWIKKGWDSLKGKRTYLVAITAGVLNFSVAMGYINPTHLDQINSFLAALGLAAVRSAI